MAKATGVLGRWRMAARTRLERLEAAAERAAGEILEKSYRDTAEQSLRGVEAVDKILDSRKAARGRAAEKKRGPKKARPKSAAARKILGAVRKRAARKASPAPKRKGR